MIADYLPYVHRPALWPEIGRRLAWRLRHRGPRLEAHHAANRELALEAGRWCAARATDSVCALAGLGGEGGAMTALERRHGAVIADAIARVEGCPVKMGGAGNLALLYALCEQIEARTVLETGVAYGWSSLAILLSIVPRGGALHSTDLPYFGLDADCWVGVAVPADLRAGWRLYRMADREGVPRALRASRELDLVHYDSDKSAVGRAWAYRKLWAGLRPGGMLVSDDIGDNLAFRDFCEGVGADPVVVAYDAKFIGVARKDG